jgi:transposase-like protein
MERKAFQVWLSGADTLTEAQKAETGEVLAGRSVGEASFAAIELGIGEDRCCPRCGATGAVANGKARGLQRYLCKACGRSFGALTGTRLSGLHRKEEWLTFGACLAEGDSIKASAERCGVAVSTAFCWRHRFLEAVETGAGKLRGIVEADETFVLGSRKGDRAWKRAKEGAPDADPPDRKACKRGGKAAKRGLSHELVPVLVAADRSGATFSAVLPSISAAALTTALKPVIGTDALLVTEGGTSYPACAAALGVGSMSKRGEVGDGFRCQRWIGCSSSNGILWDEHAYPDPAPDHRRR